MLAQRFKKNSIPIDLRLRSSCGIKALSTTDITYCRECTSAQISSPGTTISLVECFKSEPLCGSARFSPILDVDSSFGRRLTHVIESPPILHSESRSAKPYFPESPSLSEQNQSAFRENQARKEFLKLEVEHMRLLLEHVRLAKELDKEDMLIHHVEEVPALDEKSYSSVCADHDDSSLVMHSESSSEEPQTAVASTDMATTQLVSSGQDHTKADTMPYYDITRSSLYNPSADYASFFDRPVVLHTFNLGHGMRYTAKLYPWYHLVVQPPVRNKMSLFAFFRANIEVEFLVNGGPTYFGHLLVSYTPKNYERNVATHAEVAGSQEVGDFDLVQHSQRQHIWLDPTTSSGGTMVLPFINDVDYLQHSKSGDTNAQADLKQALKDFGVLTLKSAAPLQCTSTVSSSHPHHMTITVLARFRNMELVSPTDQMPLSESSDEYGQGIVSKPASAIARAMGHLSIIPEIAPLAMGASAIAAGVSGIATYFGFCRPINLDPVRKYRPQCMGMLANAEIEEATEKLTFDPKQGVSHDPGICGEMQSGDDLDILSFCQRESLVGSFRWAGNNSPGTKLFSKEVNPTIFRKIRFTGGQGEGRPDHAAYQMTPMCMASQLFRFWRGGITYRFVVQASAYHRGRLLFMYRPMGNLPSTMEGVNLMEYQSRIVDISENREFEITVHWQQAEPFRNIRAIGAGVGTENSTKVCFAPDSLNKGVGEAQDIESWNPLEDETNGQFAIYVLNDLTSLDITDSNFSLNILWFAKAAPDFEVGVASAANTSRLSMQPPLPSSKKYLHNQRLQSEASIDGPSALSTTSLVLDPVGVPTPCDSRNLVFFGETFTNFRHMFKRYVKWGVHIPVSFEGAQDADDMIAKTGATEFHLRLPAFPPRYGRVLRPNSGNSDGLMVMRETAKSQTNEGAATGPTDANINPFANPPWVYLSTAFLGRRGGIRWKFALYNTDSYASDPCVMSARHIVNDSRDAINNRADKYSCHLFSMGGGHADTSIKYGTQGLLNTNDGRTNTGFMVQKELTISNNTKNSYSGMAITHCHVNPCLEIEIPFYRKTRYVETALDVRQADTMKQAVSVEVYYNYIGNSVNVGTQYGCTSYCATGEDFSLLKFVNCPTFYYYAIDAP